MLKQVQLPQSMDDKSGLWGAIDGLTQGQQQTLVANLYGVLLHYVAAFMSLELNRAVAAQHQITMVRICSALYQFSRRRQLHVYAPA